jgi:hypothetical protein
MIHADGFPFWQEIKQYTSLKTTATTFPGKGTILASFCVDMLSITWFLGKNN